MSFRMTYPTAAVLQALSLEYRYGFEIAEVVGLRPGSVYQVLRRLEEAGYARGEWEQPQVAQQDGRPPRRYYRLAGKKAQALLQEARQRFPGVAHLPGVAAQAARP